MPRVPAWHVDHVKADDDRKLSEVMESTERRTGEHVTKSGTIRRAVRELWEREVGKQ